MSDQGNETTKSDSDEEQQEGTINDPLTQTDADAPKKSWSGGSEE